MTTTPNPVFKFNRDTYTVKVENIADSVSRREIVDLFSNLIGEIRRCEEYTNGSRRVIGLTFHTHDAAKKALCMSGYNVDGHPLPIKQNKQPDNRRNLYVLGLPFDLTEVEFVDIFSRHGKVSHAVILATVDNASRRRGFVVMNTHNEAKCAMDNLSRKEIKGHTIDVSWAVVQRSQGFLDGGDRTTVISSDSPSPSPTPFEFVSVNSGLPRNLPSVLFSQPTDLHPLFCPFGEIKKLEILEPSPEDVNQGNISVVLEYATVVQAKEARDTLHGQLYSNKPVSVEFLQVAATSTIDIGVLGPPDDSTQLRLNPRAPAFAGPTGLGLDYVFATAQQFFVRPTRNETHNAAVIQNGLSPVNPYSTPPYAPSPSLYSHLCVPVAETARPNSAPSLWVNDGLQSRSGRWGFSQLPHLSNPSTPSIESTYS
ncbi:hypothetical protein B0H21DRAFT_857420 [Amylocystis lapponica]|nr:hypothetical protein B0H21DRAFT_857420 [Amylocystis lapponica]